VHHDLLVKTSCPGWWRDATRTVKVHAAPLILADDGEPGPPTTTICPACKEAFLAMLPKKEAMR
jgi:hypothetical protein